MKRAGVAFAILAVLMVGLGLPGASLAEVRPGAFTLSPMIGGYGFDNDRDLDDLGRMANLGIGYNFSKYFSSELSFGFIHTDGDLCCNAGNVYGYQPRLDFLYYPMPNKMFVPYLAIGASYLFFDDDDVADNEFQPFEVDDTAQANAGLGAKLFVSDSVALRADARYYYGFNDSESEFAVLAGLEFQIGAKAEPAPEPCEDVDNDGICDDEDPCIDVDADGVCDDRDNCPDTPAGVRVDETGCKVRLEPEMGMERAVEAPEVIEEPEAMPEMMTVIVYFDFDKAVIKQLYYKRLADLADFLNQYPDLLAAIEGHTDAIGTDAYNIRLSERRAEAVKNFLVERHGIDPSRFLLRRFGETQPAAPNNTKENRALNRRVITITVMPE